MKNDNMDYLNTQKHNLSSYFERLAMDERLFPTHISLFMAMFYFSSGDYPGTPFQVRRPKLMRFARIKSIATYHKNINDLVQYGYIEYYPSWHPIRGSQIKFIVNDNNN